MTELLETLQGLTAIVEKHATEPYGPPASDELRRHAGQACIQFCDGDRDKARTLYKLVVQDFGYLPFAAATALVRAATTSNLIPDIEAPTPS